jgi:phenylalanyl-tRNA synthetase beta chain
MTNVKFQRKEFEKHVKINDDIMEKISLFGTPLESISDHEIEVEIFPNRPDLISLEGYMRSFRSFLGKDAGLKEYKVKKPEKDFKVVVEKEVKDVRPFTVCAIVKNLSFDDEKLKRIIDLQEKLHITLGRNRKKAAIGIYPLDKIALPIRYTAKRPEEIKFTPLEQKKELNARQILQKHPAGKKYSDLLKGQKLFPVFIDSQNKILSMPPIINSQESGKVAEKTKDVFVECSGTDLATLKKALSIITTTLADMGGDIYQMEIHDGKKETTPDLKAEKMKVSLDNINGLLGIRLNQGQLKSLLKKMGYEYDKGIVSVPAWRTDVLHEVDISEDVAIAYGYDKFVPEIPNVATIGSESHQARTKDTISEILVGLGLMETLTYHLIKQDEVKSMQIQNPIYLETSKTEFKALRPNLLIPALRTLSENSDNEYPQKIFEIGRVFERGIKKVNEKDSLVVALTPANFTDAKQHIEYLFRMLGISYSLKEKKINGLIEGRTGEIIINNKSAGCMGEVHPLTLKKWRLKMPLAIIEISLEEIYNLLR